jgi:2-phospho-L-lactate guanylyltransferase
MPRTLAQAMPEVWAVVPAKRFALAKQRLAAVLSKSERTKLAQTMFQDVLATLSATPEISGIVVVSEDPVARTLTADTDIRLVGNVLEAGINNAVLQGLRTLDPARASALVVPADVPFATAEEIGAVVHQLRKHPLVLVPALSDGGTNAIAARSPALIEPRFGENSFHHHQVAARRRGLDCGVVRAEGLGRDIDRPEDLIVPPTVRKNTLTAALLRDLNVSSRLAINAQPVSVGSL